MSKANCNAEIKQVSDPTGVYGFAYDNMGRLIGTTTQYLFLPGQTFTNAYTYDAASNRKSLTAPDGSITTYGYDSLNRLNGLSNSWAGSFGRVAHPLKQLVLFAPIPTEGCPILSRPLRKDGKHGP